MIPRSKTGKALARLIEQLGRGDVEGLLGEWNGSELSEDGTRLVCYDRRNDAGKWTHTKTEFFEWLFSDEPFDPAHYSQDEDWAGLINRAREIAEGV